MQVVPGKESRYEYHRDSGTRAGYGDDRVGAME
jgi:hypothetical protein